MKLETITLNTRGGNQFIYRTPSRNLPQLFCIHGGIGLGADSLTSGLEGLAKTFDLVFYDHRGCGKSDAAPNSSYTLDEFTNDLIEIVNKFSNGNLRGVFAHSLGGMVAIRALASSPNLFDFAIIANSAIDDSWRAAAAKAVETLTDVAAVNSASKRFDDENQNSDYLRNLAVEYGPIYFPELSSEESKKQMNLFSFRADSVTFASNYVYPGMNLSKEAATIKQPTLVIAAERDVVVPKVCQEKMSDLLPNGNLVVIKGAGHFPFITKKIEFETSITQWWEKTKELIK